MSGDRQTARQGWWLGRTCLFVACWLAWSAPGAESLDELLTCLETNGVLADRVTAVDAGLVGILQSIDPQVAVSSRAAGGEPAGDKVAAAVQAVELWPENLAYLKVGGLEPGSGSEILTHLKALRECSGMLLDLRGACGEDLASACVLGALSRSEGSPLFVVTDNRGGAQVTNGVAAGYTWVPLLMILIDEKTGGASEALASVLKGAPGILMIGTGTRGECKLRERIALPGGRTAWIATRKWALLDRTVDGIGVQPDIEVKQGRGTGGDGHERRNHHDRAESAKSEADRDLMMRVEGDAALQRATDLLLGLQALGGYGRE